MTAEKNNEGPVIQDDALLDKIETLYREADELSAALKPSSSVKSQDVTRLPIIGSLPVTTAERQNAAPSQKDSLQPSSLTAETDMMTTIVLTGIVSRPGSEHGRDNTISLAYDNLEKSFPPSSSDDPFIAIKNAVEIAGQSDNEKDDNLPSSSSKGQSESQTSNLAQALAETIRQQIDSAIEARIAAIQEAGKTTTPGKRDDADVLKKNLSPKRKVAKSAIKKGGKIAQKMKNPTTTTKPTKKTTPITKTSAKNTQASEKPARKQTKKTTGAIDD